MLRGLLLDYGGVMTSSVVGSFAAFCATEGIDVDVFRGAIMDSARRSDSPFERVEIGAITADEFDRAVAVLLSEACGKQIGSERLKQRLFAAAQPDERMWDAVRTARSKGVRTGLLSNSWGGGDYPTERFGDVFDAVVISGEVRMRKPDPKIYLHAAEAIGVPATACVFVDDFRVNVEGAQATGMTGVLHRDADRTIPTLEDLLEIPLRD